MLEALKRELRLRPYRIVTVVLVVGVLALGVYREVTAPRLPVPNAEPSCVTAQKLTMDCVTEVDVWCKAKHPKDPIGGCMAGVMVNYPHYYGPGVHLPTTPGLPDPNSGFPSDPSSP